MIGWTGRQNGESLVLAEGYHPRDYGPMVNLSKSKSSVATLMYDQNYGHYNTEPETQKEYKKIKR